MAVPSSLSQVSSSFTVTVPFTWYAGIVLVGYLADRASFSEGSWKTALLTAGFPAVENYLWLLAAFVVSLLIALLRQRLDAAARERAQRIARQRRRRSTAAEENNLRVTSRVRDIERAADLDRERTAERARSAQQARTVTRPRRAASTSATDRGPLPPESRTRSAEELRAASDRRRAREESARASRHRGEDPSLDL